jgi:hypothetical protein
VGFVCSVCGEFHEERMLDVRLGLPEPIFLLDEDERESRTWLADDFASLDAVRYFVRGLLEIPIPELGTAFGYGTWIEVDRSDFEHMLENWDSPAQFAPVEGVLANALEPYPATIGLRAVMTPTSIETLPSVELVDAPNELVRDQRNGISVAKSDTLAASVLHG